MVVSRTIIGIFDYHNFKYNFIVTKIILDIRYFYYYGSIFLLNGNIFNYVDIPGIEAIFLCYL